jgi:hypothetical protein
MISLLQQEKDFFETQNQKEENMSVFCTIAKIGLNIKQWGKDEKGIILGCI